MTHIRVKIPGSRT